MKKIILLTILLSFTALTCVNAQQGEIIYREFDPPLKLIMNIYGPAQTLELDFDGDGEADHRYYAEYWDFHVWDLYEVSLNGWEIRLVCLDENDNIITYNANDTLIPSPTYNANDSLGPYSPFGWRRGPDFAYYYEPDNNSNGIYHEHYGIHKVIDGKNYYGWYHGYGSEGREYSGGPYLYKIYIDKIAFCTVPDYPLVYGQTSLTEGVEENGESQTFANFHPNPTNSLVTITGENLRQAEVFNMLGQQVLCVQGKDNELHIDMTALPAGIYFVNVIDEEGRKCMRKVVRE